MEMPVAYRGTYAACRGAHRSVRIRISDADLEDPNYVATEEMSGVGSNFGSSGTWKLPTSRKNCYISIYWMGGRVVEATGLEKRTPLSFWSSALTSLPLWCAFFSPPYLL